MIGGSMDDDEDLEPNIGLCDGGARRLLPMQEGFNSDEESSSSSEDSKIAAPRPTIDVVDQIVNDQYGDSGLYTGRVTADGRIPHGRGVMMYENEREYNGDWSDGRWHGQGEWVNPNGDRYNGSFVFERRQGEGTYSWANGNTYTGQFFQDQRHGNGVFTFANGNVYKGEFVNGVFEGEGRYTFDNNNGFYQGGWKGGKYHGIGILQPSDGRPPYRGTFAHGVAEKITTVLLDQEEEEGDVAPAEEPTPNPLENPPQKPLQIQVKEGSTTESTVATTLDAQAMAEMILRGRNDTISTEQPMSVSKEKSGDRKSSLQKSEDTGESGFSKVSFSKNLTQTVEVEDLTRTNTSWGDIREDLFYNETQLEGFKYDAFMEAIEDEEGDDGGDPKAQDRNKVQMDVGENKLSSQDGNKTVDDIIEEINQLDINDIQLDPETDRFLKNVKAYLDCFDELERLYEKVDPDHKLANYDMPNINLSIQQVSETGEPVKNLEELYEVAETMYPVFVRKVEGLVEEVTSGSPKESSRIKLKIYPGLKAKDRAYEKAQDDYSEKVPGPPQSWLYDIVRGSVLFESAEQLFQFLEVLRAEESIVIVKSKNRFRDPALSGCRDFNVQIQITNDDDDDGNSSLKHICELQLHISAIQEAARELKSHHHYESLRKYYAGATDTLKERMHDLRVIFRSGSLDMALLANVIKNPLEVDQMTRLADLFENYMNQYQLAIMITNAMSGSLEPHDWYMRMGQLFHRQGKVEETMVLYQAALEIFVKAYGREEDSFDDNYVWGEQIDVGTFSVVHKARSKETDKIFAAKKVSRKDLHPRDAVALTNEISALQKIAECEHVVTLYDVYDEPDYTTMVLEIMDGGDLIDRIMEKKRYTEYDAKEVSRNLIMGIVHCHKLKIANRNIKLENLLLIAGSDTGVKISDFGYAKTVTFPNSLRTQCGTEGYMAPEILEDTPAYDVACDMWSLGVVIFVVLGGYRPFRGEEEEVKRRIRHGEYKFHKRYWSHVSEEAKSLIQKMLTVDPNQRITAEEALKSEWVTSSGQLLEDSLDECKEDANRAGARTHSLTALDWHTVIDLIPLAADGGSAASPPYNQQLRNDRIQDVADGLQREVEQLGASISQNDDTELFSIMRKLRNLNEEGVERLNDTQNACFTLGRLERSLPWDDVAEPVPSARDTTTLGAPETSVKEFDGVDGQDASVVGDITEDDVESWRTSARFSSLARGATTVFNSVTHLCCCQQRCCGNRRNQSTGVGASELPDEDTDLNNSASPEIRRLYISNNNVPQSVENLKTPSNQIERRTEDNHSGEASTKQIPSVTNGDLHHDTNLPAQIIAILEKASTESSKKPKLREESKKFLSTLQKYLDCRKKMDARYGEIDHSQSLEDVVDMLVAQADPWVCNADRQQQSVHKQPVETLDELYEAAKQVQPVYKTIVENVASSLRAKHAAGYVDMTVVVCDLKERRRAKEKAEDDYSKRRPKPAFSWLYDVVRGSVEFGSAQLVTEFLKGFLELVQEDQNITVVKAKNRFKEPSLTGYRDLNIHFKIQSVQGFHHICELQIHLKAIKQLDKELRTHMYYKYFRSYFAGATSALKERLKVLKQISDGEAIDDSFVTKLLENDADTERLERLGVLIRDQLCEYQLAFRVFIRVLEINKSHHGVANPRVARSYRDIALVLKEQGKLDEAMVLHQESLKIYLEAYDDQHSAVSNTYFNMALLLREQDHLEQSMGLFQLSLAIDKRNLGEESMPVANTYNCVGTVLRKQGKVDEALDMFKKSLQIKTRLLKNDDWSIADSLQNIAIALKRKGVLEYSEVLFRASIDIATKSMGENHVSIAAAYRNMALLLEKRRKNAAALDAYNRALDVYKLNFGNNHKLIADIYNDMACLYHSEGDLTEAKSLMLKSWNIKKKLLAESTMLCPPVDFKNSGHLTKIEDQERMVAKRKQEIVIACMNPIQNNGSEQELQHEKEACLQDINWLVTEIGELETKVG